MGDGVKRGALTTDGGPVQAQLLADTPRKAAAFHPALWASPHAFRPAPGGEDEQPFAELRYVPSAACVRARGHGVEAGGGDSPPTPCVSVFVVADLGCEPGLRQAQQALLWLDAADGGQATPARLALLHSPSEAPSCDQMRPRDLRAGLEALAALDLLGDADGAEGTGEEDEEAAMARLERCKDRSKAEHGYEWTPECHQLARGLRIGDEGRVLRIFLRALLQLELLRRQAASSKGNAVAGGEERGGLTEAALRGEGGVLLAQGLRRDGVLARKWIYSLEEAVGAAMTAAGSARHADTPEVLGLRPGEAALVINGQLRSLGALESALDAGALGSLVTAEVQSGIAAAVLRAQPRSSAGLLHASLLLRARAAAMPPPPPPCVSSAADASLRASGAPLEAGVATAALQIVGAFDPLSQGVRPTLALLRHLTRRSEIALRLYLLPKADLGKDKLALPRPSLYRYVLPSASGDGEPPRADFAGVPTRHVYTVHLHHAEWWATELRSAADDLDNLQLAEGGAVNATYLLRGLRLRGKIGGNALHGRSAGSIQLLLSSASRLDLVSTVLPMTSNGFWQLVAPPGLYLLRTASAQGQPILQMGAEGAGAAPPDRGRPAPVALSATDAADAWASSCATVVPLGGLADGGGTLQLTALAREGTAPPGGVCTDLRFEHMARSRLDVFSIASGHLYERFLRIMMTSVLQHTAPKHTKFWLLGEFLSPRFKAELPKLAAHHGCEYGLLDYPWPEGVRPQEQKLRTIWGYKVLFLDVLFPAEVSKVVFIDADQVVRADVRELLAIDLRGAPLAMTPFCDSRASMEGFRFWKQGFWKQHLQGKPYHISALFVADLARLRVLGGGDKLRAIYQSLSADPNSLANLDQDLPNYAQHQLGIHSLPKEWLWCEAWCDDASKPAARTIDLCNNPQTKEPKLQAASRIIGETWHELDAAAAKVAASEGIGTKDEL